MRVRRGPFPPQEPNPKSMGSGQRPIGGPQWCERQDANHEASASCQHRGGFESQNAPCGRVQAESLFVASCWCCTAFSSWLGKRRQRTGHPHLLQHHLHQVGRGMVHSRMMTHHPHGGGWAPVPRTVQMTRMGRTRPIEVEALGEIRQCRSGAHTTGGHDGKRRATR